MHDINTQSPEAGEAIHCLSIGLLVSKYAQSAYGCRLLKYTPYNNASDSTLLVPIIENKCV